MAKAALHVQQSSPFSLYLFSSQDVSLARVIWPLLDEPDSQGFCKGAGEAPASSRNTGRCPQFTGSSMLFTEWVFWSAGVLVVCPRALLRV